MTPWTELRQALLSVGFSRQECGRGLPFPSPGDLPDPGIKPGSLVAQMVKRPPTVWETQVRSLGREDPLEKEMATHPRILAWKIPWTEEPGRLQSMGLQRVRHD